jgi:hypothetical protein
VVVNNSCGFTPYATFILAEAAGCECAAASRIRTGGGFRSLLFISVSFAAAVATLRTHGPA